jgi:hypothetical protein
VREGAEVNEPQSSNPATSIALKPCPFCDGVAELDTCQPYLALGTGKLGKAVAVYCTTCSAHMTECVEDHRDVPREDVTTYVVGLWNARKQPDETPVLYTKAEAETLCAIAAAGVQHVSALDAAPLSVAQGSLVRRATVRPYGRFRHRRDHRLAIGG